MQRRSFIRLGGGGLVWAATAGGGIGLSGCSASQMPAGAVAAWQPPAAQADLRHGLLAHALLAPNPHNLQPWQADLATPGQITLRLDPQRLLPATDPYGRQILLGAGAFLELLLMAAAARGQRAELDLFPQGEPAARSLAAVHRLPVATVRLVADATQRPDPLFSQVFQRRTDRRAYDPQRPPSAADLQRLKEAAASQPLRFGVATAADGPRLAAIQAITREAWRTELTTEEPMMESMRLLRLGAAEIDQHRDGISITSPLLVALDRLGLFDRHRFPAADSQAVRSQLEDFDAITASTPAYFWLVSEGNARTQQVAAGRAHLRVNLAASAAGLALHPNQQALQEYPQVAQPHQALHALLDAPPPRYTVQMLARLGHLPAGMPAPGPAPRRGLARQFGV